MCRGFAISFIFPVAEVCAKEARHLPVGRLASGSCPVCTVTVPAVVQEQLAVARKGFACLESQLEARGEPPAAGRSLPGLPSRRDSDGDLPHPNSLPGAASRDMLLSQLVTWDPTAPDASAPANVLRQFQEVDRPLAPLAAQIDTDTSLSADSSLLWVRLPPAAHVFYLSTASEVPA